jgi:hypothetical protein
MDSPWRTCVLIFVRMNLVYANHSYSQGCFVLRVVKIFVARPVHLIKMDGCIGLALNLEMAQSNEFERLPGAARHPARRGDVRGRSQPRCDRVFARKTTRRIAELPPQ